MGDRTAVQLLIEFRRGGSRTLAEACELLAAWDFSERRTGRGHSVWVHRRGATLTITTERELKTYYRRKIIQVIESLRRPSF